jgi:dTMP kinase
VFSSVVLHAGTSGFGVLLTAFGLGMAMAVIGVTLLQRHLSHRRVFTGAVFVGGVMLIGGATMSQLILASVWIAGFGACTGTAYVLGFSMLQSEVSDELRGRIFATLYACTRLCLFLALVVAPFISTVLDGVSSSAVGRRITIGGATAYLPGVRLTLWLGGLVILTASVFVRRAFLSAEKSAAPDPVQE